MVLMHLNVEIALGLWFEPMYNTALREERERENRERCTVKAHFLHISQEAIMYLCTVLERSTLKVKINRPVSDVPCRCF